MTVLEEEVSLLQPDSEEIPREQVEEGYRGGV
jgi:hypothetical protein